MNNLTILLLAIQGMLTYINGQSQEQLFSYNKEYSGFSNINKEIIIDQDGNTYTTKVIGNQVWMLENLRVITFANGDSIPFINDFHEWPVVNHPATAYYNNDSLIEKHYGKLYNWHIVSDTRNVCPLGWHVPNDNDWIQLKTFLEYSSISSNNNGTLSNFASNFGGYRSSHGDFSLIGDVGIWWSSSFYSEKSISGWAVYSNSSLLQNKYFNKEFGLSIRCVKD
jgi:uncharacterized protein (TIGR02145 family)